MVSRAHSASRDHCTIAPTRSTVYRLGIWDIPEDALSTTTAEPKQTLLAELTAEHRRLDEQLQVLERRRALTPAEQVEMSRLKKQKLLTKDRIARLS